MLAHQSGHFRKDSLGRVKSQKRSRSRSRDRLAKRRFSRERGPPRRSRGGGRFGRNDRRMPERSERRSIDFNPDVELEKMNKIIAGKKVVIHILCLGASQLLPAHEIQKQLLEGDFVAEIKLKTPGEKLGSLLQQAKNIFKVSYALIIGHENERHNTVSFKPLDVNVGRAAEIYFDECLAILKEGHGKKDFDWKKLQKLDKSKEFVHEKGQRRRHGDGPGRPPVERRGERDGLGRYGHDRGDFRDRDRDRGRMRERDRGPPRDRDRDHMRDVHDREPRVRGRGRGRGPPRDRGFQPPPRSRPPPEIFDGANPRTDGTFEVEVRRQPIEVDFETMQEFERIRIKGVRPGGQGEELALSVGDLLVGVNGKLIMDPSRLAEQVQRARVPFLLMFKRPRPIIERRPIRAPPGRPIQRDAPNRPKITPISLRRQPPPQDRRRDYPDYPPRQKPRVSDPREERQQPPRVSDPRGPPPNEQFADRYRPPPSRSGGDFPEHPPHQRRAPPPSRGSGRDPPPPPDDGYGGYRPPSETRNMPPPPQHHRDAPPPPPSDHPRQVNRDYQQQPPSSDPSYIRPPPPRRRNPENQYDPNTDHREQGNNQYSEKDPRYHPQNNYSTNQRQQEQQQHNNNNNQNYQNTLAGDSRIGPSGESSNHHQDTRVQQPPPSSSFDHHQQQQHQQYNSFQNDTNSEQNKNINGSGAPSHSHNPQPQQQQPVSNNNSSMPQQQENNSNNNSNGEFPEHLALSNLLTFLDENILK